MRHIHARRIASKRWARMGLFVTLVIGLLISAGVSLDGMPAEGGANGDYTLVLDAPP